MNTLIALAALTAANAASVSLALSDGTPVEFVKITSKNNIQVRLPESHALAQDDDLRIFRRDGSHFKDETDLKLVSVAPAAAAAPTATPAAAPAAAPIANDDNVTYTVDGNSFDNFDDAKQEAIDLFVENGGEKSFDILATTTKVVGTVGLSLAA